MVAMSPDTTNPIRPAYYRSRDGARDVLDFCLEHHLDFPRGNICKYTVRSMHAADPRPDLLKAMEYLRRLLADCNAQAEAAPATEREPAFVL